MNNTNVKEGCVYKTQTGRIVRVQKRRDSGSQGSIWNITYDGKNGYLLKFIHKPNEAIRNNIDDHQKNSYKLPEAFIWPEDIVDNDILPKTEAIAYVMKEVPDNYKSLQKFLWPKGSGNEPEERFATMDVQIQACVNIVKAFYDLQLKGRFYQDLSENNFLIDPNIGDVKIIDTDNICDGIKDTGIIGTPGYIAPEVILGKNRPNKNSDLFSMAVILFSILCRGNPLIGKNVRSYKFRDDKKLFGENPVFIFDAKDKSNRPVQGMDNGVILCWPLCPVELQQAFQRAFSYEALHNPQKRMQSFEWLELLLDVRARLVFCLNCGSYYSDNQKICPKCETTKGNFFRVKTSNNTLYPIYPGKILVEHNFCGNKQITPVLRCAINKSNNRLGLVNLSANIWNVGIKGKDASMNNFTLKPKQGIDIPSGCDIHIDLGNNLKAVSIDTRRI